MLVLGPSWFVVIPASAETTAPWRDQEIVRGSSPLLMIQMTWAKSPSSRVSLPNVRGIIAGGSENHDKFPLGDILK